MGVLGNNALVGASAAGAGGGANFYEHQIANSTRYNQSASAHMYRTNGTATNADICTMSAWVKRTKLGSNTAFTGAYDSAGWGGGYLTIGMENSDNFKFLHHPDSNAGTQGQITSTALYRDSSAFYHVVVAYDSSQATAANRVKIYINGSQLTDITATTYPDQNQDFILNKSGCKIFIGSGGDSGGNAYQPWDGYIAEYVMIDGTAYAASDFGESKNGVWIPKDPSGLTFGNNGVYCKFESSGDLGNDSSGNNNDFTVSNVSAHDQMLDTPTFNSNSNGGNFPTYNPLLKAPTGLALSESNLKATLTVDDNGIMTNWQVPVTGKWYWEIDVDNIAGSHGVYIGVMPANTDLTINQESNNLGLVYYSINGNSILKGTRSSYGATYTTGDIISIAVDRDADTIQFYKNGSGQGTIDISSLDEEFFCYMGYTGGSGPCSTILNFGQDGTFAGNVTAGGNSDATGYGNFKYAVPSGFKALCQGNLPTNTSISPAETDDNYPQKLFSAILYTGNGGTNNITGLGFQPDWTWIKERGGANDHKITDSTRGVTKAWESNTGNAETTDTNGLTAFGTDGFTVGSDAVYNNSSDTYVAWNWRLNGGTTAVNTVGGTSSVTQVDPSGGISVVTYTGFAGSSGSSTVGHGMSLAPEMVIHVSRYGGGAGWWTQAPNVLTNAGYFLNLNSTGAQTDLNSYGTMNAPTTSVFTINGVEGVGGSSRNYVAYCFANIEGFCKVGSYVGNGNDDGTFVYTGFRPAMMIIKELVVDDWLIYDDKRVGYNNSSAGNAVLYPNGSYAEENQASRAIDILSNGFKLRTSNATGNASSGTYVYLAMAHNPFKYSLAR